jgi:hypothetical protein
VARAIGWGLLSGLLGGLPGCGGRGGAPAAGGGGAAPRDAERVPTRGGAEAAPAPERRTFAATVAALSEPGGYFDSDNLLSNERSYLHALTTLDRLGVRGGAYVGVGPDQSFSYIARVRPAVAYLVDVRRDNVLQHLVFRALFAAAPNRLAYLALLTGRPVPADVARWDDRPIAAIVAHVDSATPTPASTAAARAVVAAGVQAAGIPLSEADRAMIGRIHDAFIDAGLDLRYTSHGRPPRPYYPTLRDLVLERDLAGAQASFLAREADFEFVKRLQAADRVIPVTGDLAGAHALRAVGEDVRRRGLGVTVLYTSNVEDYLMRDGRFEAFARTVAGLPIDARGVIVRSYFGSWRGPHPQTVPGHASTQVVQTLASFVAGVARGGYGSYWELVTRDVVPVAVPAAGVP